VDSASTIPLSRLHGDNILHPLSPSIYKTDVTSNIHRERDDDETNIESLRINCPAPAEPHRNGCRSNQPSTWTTAKTFPAFTRLANNTAPMPVGGSLLRGDYSTKIATLPMGGHGFVEVQVWSCGFCTTCVLRSACSPVVSMMRNACLQASRVPHPCGWLACLTGRLVRIRRH
jgi:hypothetical protein